MAVTEHTAVCSFLLFASPSSQLQDGGHSPVSARQLQQTSLGLATESSGLPGPAAQDHRR